MTIYVNTENLPLSHLVGRGGSVVGSVPCVLKVTGSNPTLAAT